jgi:hypothetical protein
MHSVAVRPPALLGGRAAIGSTVSGGLALVRRLPDETCEPSYRLNSAPVDFPVQGVDEFLDQAVGEQAPIATLQLHVPTLQED